MDIINDSNLVTYGLAIIDDDDKISRVVKPIVAALAGPTAHGSTGGPILIVVASPPQAPVANEGETSKCPLYISRGTTLAPEGSSHCVYDLFDLVVVPSFYFLYSDFSFYHFCSDPQRLVYTEGSWLSLPMRRSSRGSLGC